ncbi:hypothetical protein AMR42_00795 [Limnothrix sp. PR1529]|nr:hypothetical protein BCR12_13705 [Limnothrix sp. P13C2]PIB15372.1 hypothetical protein AMR42_00795 [Limnothrix sp. PR1529]
MVRPWQRVGGIQELLGDSKDLYSEFVCFEILPFAGGLLPIEQKAAYVLNVLIVLRACKIETGEIWGGSVLRGLGWILEVASPSV